MSVLLPVALVLTFAAGGGDAAPPHSMTQATGEAQFRLRFELQPAQESQPAQTLLHIEGLADPAAPTLRRDGSEIVLRLPDVAPDGVSVPDDVAPVQSLRLATTKAGLELRFRCDPSVALEVRRSVDALVLVLTGSGPAPGIAERRPGFTEMYRSLFPAGLLAENTAAAEESVADDQPAGGDTSGGLSLGPISLRPSLLVAYVDGDNTILDSEPVREHYFQIEPRLGLNAVVQLLGGRLRVAYQPAFRKNSRIEKVRRTSHEFDASLEQPVGAALTLRARLHHARATLETSEVDPGREYFFNLGSFRRTSFDVGARFETGGRFDLDLSGTLNQVRFQEAAYFFDFDDRGLRAELGYDLSRAVRAGLGYVWTEVPNQSVASRREAASHSRGLRLALAGETAELSGELSLQYQTREHPQAAADGRRFAGLVAGARLRRELRPGAALALDLSRATTLSAFESNGFYVANVAELVATLPLPLRLSLRAGLGYQRNAYEAAATELGVPRRDTLTAWTLGLGRAFTRWAYARVDYRSERRDSNLDTFDNSTRTFIAQVGVGWLGGTGESR